MKCRGTSNTKKSISIITVHTPTELSTKHIYKLNATDDLQSSIIPLAVEHRTDHKYPKLLNIPPLNTEYNAVHILRKTVLGKLQPIEIENVEVSNFHGPKKILIQQIAQ